MSLKFEDPGVGGNARLDHAAIAAELRENPGQWAVVAEQASPTTATQIKTGKLSAYRPSGSFESVARGISSGRAERIYARFVGEVQP